MDEYNNIIIHISTNKNSKQNITKVVFIRKCILNLYICKQSIYVLIRNTVNL